MCIQEARPESLLFLGEVTRKIKTYLNDKRIARERQRRTGQAVTTRGWYAPAEMWVRGAVAVDQAAPEQQQQQAEQAPGVRPFCWMTRLAFYNVLLKFQGLLMCLQQISSAA